MICETTAAAEQQWMREQLAGVLARPQWRIWLYPEPAIVLGVSQRSRQAEVAARSGPGLEVLARPSGGGAVLVGPWMVGVTVLLPAAHRLAAGSLADSYRWLGELHAQVLREAGVAARTVSVEEAREAARAAAGAPAGAAADAAATSPPLAWACFGSLSPWEVVDGAGRKLVGLAQQRRATGVAFVAGTLVREPEWAALCEALDRVADLDALRNRTSNCLDSMRSQRAPSGGASVAFRDGDPMQDCVRGDPMRRRIAALLDGRVAAMLA